jgi:methyl-accepting chemotaxis protein
MNLANLLESMLFGWAAEHVTNSMILLLLAGFVFAILCGRKQIYPQYVQHAPNLLTSIGILGTFIGIVIGLLGFDSADIDASIGPLLDGLKTAFITSLVGMALAVVLKLLDSVGLVTRPASEEEPESATPEQILGSMQRQELALVRLAKSIAGDEEATLISQIRLMRSDHSDHARAVQTQSKAMEEKFDQFQVNLWKELASVSEMLSKSATEQVINALKEVITDFNKNLTEQFGDNFKRLDESVEKLVVWQDQYKEQLGQMREQYALGVESIGQTKELVTAIQEDTAKIPETMQALRSLLETTSHQLGELERHLEAFKDMRDRAVEAVPQIKDQINSIVSEVADAATESGRRISTVTEEMQKTLISGFEDFQNGVSRTNQGLTTASDALANRSEEISEQLSDSVKEINERMRDLMAMMERGYQEIESEITRTMAGTAEALNKKLSQAVNDTGEAVSAQINIANEALEKELERVMSNMGQALAQITNRFTEDYSRLTNEMKRVVDQARRMQ